MDSTKRFKKIQKPTSLLKHYQLGHTTFPCEIIFDRKLTQYIKGIHWDIEFYSAYNRNKIPATWAFVLGQMIKTQCETLQIKSSSTKSASSNPNLPLFLPIIVSINFISLKSLSLIKLCITSLDPLAFLNMENLQTLQLQHNNLTIIKSLNKQNWTKLNELNLYKNHIAQMEIHRTKMAHKFKHLNFDHFTHNMFWGYHNKIQLHDMRKVVKLEPSKIKQITLTEVIQEIEQPKIVEKFRKRFPDIYILSKEIFMMWT